MGEVGRPLSLRDADSVALEGMQVPAWCVVDGRAASAGQPSGTVGFMEALPEASLSSRTGGAGGSGSGRLGGTASTGLWWVGIESVLGARAGCV